MSCRQFGPPAAIARDLPANWGEYRRDVLVQAIPRSASRTQCSSPIRGRALLYASLERLRRLGYVTTTSRRHLRRGDPAVAPGSFELLVRPAAASQLVGVEPIDEAVSPPFGVPSAGRPLDFDLALPGGGEPPCTTAARLLLRAKEARSY